MRKLAVLTSTILLANTADALAHEDKLLHLAHPLATESPAPDTKVRLDYIWQRVPGHHEDDGKSDIATVQATAEYAFDESIGIEINVPYTWRDPHNPAEEDADHVDNASVALKYANHRFADKGLIVGGGLELGLPTGDDEKHIGSDHESEIAPFLSFGYRRGPVQLTGSMEFGFPVNGGHADFELGWGAAALWAATGHTDLMIEAEGEKLYGGEEGGNHPVSLAPGAAFTVPGHEHLRIGANVFVPVTQDKEFYVRPMVSVFYHF